MSIANHNYDTLVLHYIDGFVLKNILLSCERHEGRAMMDKLDEQLQRDLDQWGLDTSRFAALVSDTAINMNALC